MQLVITSQAEGGKTRMEMTAWKIEPPGAIPIYAQTYGRPGVNWLDHI